MGTAKQAVNRRVEQGEATRRMLIEVARRLFAQQGFHGTATEQVVAGAGVSRGPLYHHFKDKAELFEAVFIGLEEELNSAVGTAALSGSDTADMFRRGVEAFLDFTLRDDFRRIVLIDGPAVLGLDRWHQIDSRLGLASMELGVQALIDDGLVDAAEVRPLAVLLFGALNQAGFELAQAEDPESTKRQLLEAFLRLVGGVAASGSRRLRA